MKWVNCFLPLHIKRHVSVKLGITRQLTNRPKSLVRIIKKMRSAQLGGPVYNRRQTASNAMDVVDL